jgi:uncharacterized protein (DUF433 family)
MEQRESPEEEPRQLAPRIVSDPGILRGKPVIQGSRLSVEKVLENLACGDTFADLIDAYPFLTAEDIRAAIGYAAQLVSQAPAPMSDQEQPVL